MYSRIIDESMQFMYNRFIDESRIIDVSIQFIYNRFIDESVWFRFIDESLFMCKATRVQILNCCVSVFL
jgi:hypothetical protein